MKKMKNSCLLLLLLALLAGNAVAQKRFGPVNPKATKEARKLLKYLYKLKGKNLVSGHHNYPHELSIYTERAREITGEYPALWGSDLHQLHGNTRPDVIRETIKKHGEGNIITIMWHAGRPQDPPPYGWKSSVQAKLTDQQWQDLLTPGTEMHQLWQQRVDSTAMYLKVLHEKKIPVLWRPYHEMNGIWFWWGDKKGENGFSKLWIMLYDRLVNHHGLHNLLWVWNANAPRDRKNDEAYAYADYFPGLDYVDVLAADVYHNDYRQSHHDQLVELGQGKPLALGEVGELPTVQQLEQQPEWSWFMVWTGYVDSANTPEKVKAVYAWPKTLSLDEIKPKW